MTGLIVGIFSKPCKRALRVQVGVFYPIKPMFGFGMNKMICAKSGNKELKQRRRLKNNDLIG